MNKNKRRNPVPQPDPQAVDTPTIIQPDTPEWRKMADNGRKVDTPATSAAPDLTPRQLAALPVILASSNNAQAAADAGIGERTLYRWLDDPDFRNELIRLRQEASALARSDLEGAMSIALASLIECAQSDSPFVRYCASRYLFSTGIQLDHLQQLDQKIDKLRDTLSQN